MKMEIALGGGEREFRDLVIAEAAVASYKGKKDLKNCVDFMLEECAHACATFTETINLVYPMKISLPVLKLAERYNMHINHLKYRASTQTQNSPDHVSIDFEGIDKEVVLFMKEEVSNVNFFVKDKYGNHIYKNYAYEQLIGNTNFSRLDPENWKISLDIMEKKEQRIIEEKSPDGNHYLSVKSPLILDGKVEGIIGLAVDITDRKKREELENKLKMREELYKIAREVAHDICSPLSALEMVKYMSLDKLKEQEKKMFELSIRRIKDITNKLIEKYRGKEDKGSKEEEYIMPSSVKDIIESMRYRYQDRGIKFKFKKEEREKFAFISGEWSEFSRMITNVIKNGVEAIEGAGEIEVREVVKGEEVEIRVKDNGKGMSKDMVEKIERWEDIGTTKKEGHGIGMQQIMGTIKAMRGKVDIETREGDGVTADAMSCQTEIARKIREKEADYVLAVKEHQKTLYNNKSTLRGWRAGR
jgi:signal transduction histidine kinase